MNRAILIGNLGRDAILRFTPNQMPVANMSLATTERWKDKDSGEQKSRTEWHRIVCFGKLAEMVSKLYKKGKSVQVEGRIQTRQWEDANGIKRWTTEIVAHSCRLLGPAPKGATPEDPPLNVYEEMPDGIHYDPARDEIPF